MISNAETYLAIARDAHAEMKRLDSESRRPLPPMQDGSPRYIFTRDPGRRSLKQAMITIIFSGIYFEAVVYLTALRKFSKTDACKIDKMAYEERLPELGVDDKTLADAAKALREVRRDLVHEKALLTKGLHSATWRVAQESADQAIALVNELQRLLNDAL